MKRWAFIVSWGWPRWSAAGRRLRQGSLSWCRSNPAGVLGLWEAAPRFSWSGTDAPATICPQNMWSEMSILFSQFLKDTNCDVTSQEGATETLPSTPTRCHRHWTGSSRDCPSFSWFCSAQALLPHSDQILPSLLKPGRDCKKSLSSAGDNKDNKSLLFLISKKKITLCCYPFALKRQNNGHD